MSPFQNLPDDLKSSPTFTAEVYELFDSRTHFGRYIKDLKNKYQENLNSSSTYGDYTVVFDTIKGKKVKKVSSWDYYWSKVRNNHKQFFMNGMVTHEKPLNYDFVICALLTNILTINYLPEEMLQDELIIEIAYKYVTQNLRIFKYLPKQLQNHPRFLSYVRSLVEAEPLNGQIIRELKNSLVVDQFQSYIDKYTLDTERFARTNSSYDGINVVKLCYKLPANSPFASAYNASFEQLADICYNEKKSKTSPEVEQ